MYTQVYPNRFCRIASKLFSAHLESRRTSRTAYTSEHQARYLDNGHFEIIDDLLDIAEFSTAETEALLVVSREQTLGYTDGVGLASALSTESPIAQPSFECRRLLTAVNLLPRNSEISLESDDSKISRNLIPLVQAVRKRYLPNDNFAHCLVLRGSDSSYQPLFQLQDAVAIIWKKSTKVMQFVNVEQFNWGNFEFKDYSLWKRLDVGGPPPIVNRFRL